MRRHAARLAAASLLLGLAAGAQTADSQHPSRVLSLRIDARGRLYEGAHIRISRDTLIRDLSNGLHDGPYDAVFLSASPATRYGRVKEVTDLVQQYGPAGVKVSLTQK